MNSLLEAVAEHATARRRKLIDKIKCEQRRPTDPRQNKSERWNKELTNLALALLGDTSTRIDIENSYHFESLLDTEPTTEQFRIALLTYLIELITQNVERLTDESNDKAIQLLANTAIDLTTRLNELVLSQHHVNALLPFSRRSVVWPVLKSEHRGFNQDEKKFFSLLQIGKDLERNFSPETRWSHKTMAAYFWKEIEDARRKYRGTITPAQPALTKEQREAIRQELARPDFRLRLACRNRTDQGRGYAVAQLTLSKEKLRFVSEALALPPFNQPGAWKLWAALAKDRVVRQMKRSKKFHTAIIAALPPSKQRDWSSFLTTEFRRKFMNMVPKSHR